MAAPKPDTKTPLCQEKSHHGLLLAPSPEPSDERAPRGPIDGASGISSVLPALHSANSPTGPDPLSGLLTATCVNEIGSPIQPGEPERVISQDVGDDAYAQNKKESCKDPKPRPVPCNLALRFANRPNGTQLTTIIEQRSYSTLSSLPSLISTPRRYTSGQLSASHSSSTLSPNTRCQEGASRREVSRSLDEVALHKVFEAAKQRLQEATSVKTHSTPKYAPEQPVVDTPKDVPVATQLDTTPKDSSKPPPSPVTQPQPPPPDHEREGRPVRQVLRTLFDTVRKAPRHTLSLSALRTRPNQDTSIHDTSIFRSARYKGLSEPSTKGDSSGHTHRRKRAVHEPNVTGSVHVGYNLLSGRSASPTRKERGGRDSKATSHQPENAPGSESPAIFLRGHHIQEDQAITPSCTTPVLLRPGEISASPTPSPSQFYTPPTAPIISSKRFSIPNNAPTIVPPITPLPLSVRGRDGEDARYSFDGVLLYRPNAPSLHKYDRSRTTSGSSLSVSSSILGIDGESNLEATIARKAKATLVPYHAHSRLPTYATTNTSSNPSTPLPSNDGSDNTHATTTGTDFSLSVNAALPSVFHAPKPAAWFASKSPLLTPHPPPTHIKSHTLTSAALPVLLPFAAANGIVTTSTTYKQTPSTSTTCVTSFHSPSGNLIRVTESDSEPDVPRSSHRHSRIASPSAIDSFQHPLEPLARPVTLPATASPPSTYPLPSWLRKPAARQGGSERGGGGVTYRPLSSESVPRVHIPIRTHVHPPRALLIQPSVEPNTGPTLNHRAGLPKGRLVAHRDVHGCGGEVRAVSLQPRSGVKNKAVGMGMGMQARGCRARGVGRVMQRVRFVAVDGTVDDDNEDDERRDKGGGCGVCGGESVGWALRVCFCQPRDDGRGGE
ncbi:uncharacterized protein BDZ99DRAFT_558393 [Mytilinidion resinicola]|uniref:Uncharacterized protein n=1 Tax=Mytilinidion resinicola TaxID=574789 RepID=A0A6A6YTY9_9PEZI|nr:uncharacterized protein BDZ99DRAFT_558393 [Mytilinidion resinicola]KAF2812426.1 hypothetical protein BDZ99DRAFT_558393 [Mytilinidion resinicola]